MVLVVVVVVPGCSRQAGSLVYSESEALPD